MSALHGDTCAVKGCSATWTHVAEFLDAPGYTVLCIDHYLAASEAHADTESVTWRGWARAEFEKSEAKKLHDAYFNNDSGE